jgi:phosphoribosylformimino-5-aminoimidazole carboxamide ribotide isomerase
VRLYPAIDLRGGRCVRLYQGDYQRQTVYRADPVEQALAFEAEGAPWLHVVDLDAARTGEAANREVVAAICCAVAVPVQVGGGVRTDAAARALFDAGAARVVVGTAAFERPGLVERLVGDGRAVAVALDARGGEVATHGWTTGTGTTVAEMVARFAAAGVDAFIVTDIARDGTLAGPDLEGLRALLGATSVPIVASGGVGGLDDLRALAALAEAGRRLDGVIVGRALYEGAFSVRAALAAIGEGRPCG